MVGQRSEKQVPSCAPVPVTSTTHPILAMLWQAELSETSRQLQVVHSQLREWQGDRMVRDEATEAVAEAAQARAIAAKAEAEVPAACMGLPPNTACSAACQTDAVAGAAQRS